MTNEKAITQWETWIQSGFKHGIMPSSEAMMIGYNAIKNQTPERIYSPYMTYCNNHSSCDKCKTSIRLLCKIKCLIEKLQSTIVQKCE